MRKLAFTSDRSVVMIARYQDGMAASAIAREFGCSCPTVIRHLTELGVYEPGRLRVGARFTRAEKDAMARRYEAGESIYKLAEAYGAIPQSIYRILVSLDVKMRYHGRLANRRGAVGTNGKYVRIAVDRDDPIAAAMAWANGFVMEHRLAMAHTLGRPLEDHETVHHINGDPTDNRPENLQLRNGRHGKGSKFVCRDCGSHNVEAVPL